MEVTKGAIGTLAVRTEKKLTEREGKREGERLVVALTSRARGTEDGEKEGPDYFSIPTASFITAPHPETRVICRMFSQSPSGHPHSPVHSFSSTFRFFLPVHSVASPSSKYHSTHHTLFIQISHLPPWLPCDYSPALVFPTSVVQPDPS